MRNFLKLLILSLTSLFIVACGSSSNSVGSTSNKLKIESQNAKLNASKSKMSIDFVINNPYTSNVTVRVNALSLAIDPCGIDSVVFSPNDITFEEQNEEVVTALITFDESCTPASYQLKGSTHLTMDGNTNNVLLDSSIQNISPEENQTIDGDITEETETNTTTPETNTTEETNSSVDTINYGIKFSLEDEDVMKFNLEDKKSIEIALIDKDKGDFISSKKIVSLKVTSKQENLLKLFDATINTIPSAVVSYEKVNNIVVYVQTYTRSGLADIDVEIEYLNTNGSTEKISKTYSTMIMSGPPTAFSINDKGVSYNFETKWFEHKYLISATDKYNNIINISPTIYVNAMTDFVKDSSGKLVLYGKFGDLKANLIGDKDSSNAHIEVNSPVFNQIDYDRDYALVFGDIYSYEALGKWDINQDLSSDTTLYFSDTYNGEDYNGLGFAVGHNYMEEICDSSYREWHLKIDSSDGKYILDEEGKTTVTVKYPAEYLYGKLGAISVNFLGKNPKTDKILKSGEVYFDVWNNVEGLKGGTYKITKGSGTLPYRHVGVIDTGTGDAFALKNSHFSCKVEVTNGHFGSSTRNTIITNASECGTIGETSYVEYEITALEDEDGTISFSDCYVNGVPIF